MVVLIVDYTSSLLSFIYLYALPQLFKGIIRALLLAQASKPHTQVLKGAGKGEGEPGTH